jgi:putative MATE family efflux protein
MKANQTDPQYYLEQAPVPRAILHMAVPMIMSMILDLAYNIIDAIFVGQLGNTAMLAAITLAFPFQIALMGIGQIFGIGGGTLIARLLGEKNYTAAKKASAVNLYLALASGVVMALVSLAGLAPILNLMGASGESYQFTHDFLLVIMLGSPLIIAMITLAETIRSEGASTVSMTGMLLSVVINILLDPLFIFVFKMNVTGAALATVLANGVAVGYYLWYLKNRSKVQSVSPHDFRPSKSMVLDILKIGTSALLFSVLMIISSLLFNSYALRYGDNVVAAFGVANRVVQIVEFLGSGLFAGIVPLIAFAYSAGLRQRLNQVVSTTICFFVGVTLFLGSLFFIFRQPIFGLFSTDPAVLESGFAILTAMLVSTLFSGFCSIFTDLFQALGAGLQSNAMALIRGLIMIPLIWLGNQLLGLNGVIWSLPAAEISACLLGLVIWLVSRKNLMDRPLVTAPEQNPDVPAPNPPQPELA